MAGDLHKLEPAYSNLIDYFDMKGVKTSAKFIADCVRYAKERGIDDGRLVSTLQSCVTAVSDRPLAGEEMQNVKDLFIAKIDLLE